MTKRNPHTPCVYSLCFLVLFLAPSRSAETCRSGLEPGQRPGPYAAVISTGPQRGQSYCYICDTGDRPAVVIFARSLSDALGKLCQQLDQAVTEHKKAELRAWVSFLSEDQIHLDPRVVQWSKRFACAASRWGFSKMPAGRRVIAWSPDADLTVLLFVNQKVVANFAFRKGRADPK